MVLTWTGTWRQARTSQSRVAPPQQITTVGSAAHAAAQRDSSVSGHRTWRYTPSYTTTNSPDSKRAACAAAPTAAQPELMAEVETPPRRRRLLVFLPLAVFVLLAAIFLMQLFSGRDVSEIPSVLIGQPAPSTNLPPLQGTSLPGVDSAAFRGKVTLLNVWASWCVPCREEHPVLLELSKDARFTLQGINYKDKMENASAFLASLGNPFAAIGVDDNGRAGIDWGVYGVPETFVIGRDGKIAFKHVGPLSDYAVRTELMPEIDRALAAN